MATFDECVGRLPDDQQHWVRQVEAEAGTTDGDWAIFRGAAELLAGVAKSKELGIDLVPTTDLIAELLKRYDHAAFVAYRVYGKGNQMFTRHYTGNAATVAGLGAELTRFALAELNSADKARN